MIKYVRGVNGQIIKQESATLAGNFGGTYYYAYNIHGDVNSLFDENGTVAATYVYDAYGMVKSSTGSMASVNPIRYCGEYYDEFTQCIYLRARFYNPITMRFKQADSYLGDIGDPSSRNLYAYCGNDPINYNDFTGHWKGEIHKEMTREAFKKLGEQTLKQFKKRLKNKGTKFKSFKKHVINGSTYPDRYRGAKKEAKQVANGKGKNMFDEYFRDSNDTPHGSWHGGEHAMTKAGQIKELKQVYKFLTNKEFKKAGIYLGCILHAVQDIAAHEYAYLLKEDKLGEKDKKPREVIKNYLNKYASDTIKDELLEKYKFNGKKAFKKLHTGLADNSDVKYNGTMWVEEKKDAKGSRYNKSINRSVKVLKRFAEKPWKK